MVLLETSNSMNAVYVALIALLLVIIGVITKAVNTSAIATAIANRLAMAIGTTAALTFEKLREHDIFIKLEEYAKSNTIETSVQIHGDAKKRLYDRYCNIIASVWLSALQPFLAPNTLAMSAQQLKSLLAKQRTYAFNEYDKQFSELLLSINPDKERVRDIVEKLSLWRQGEMAIIMQNGIEACSGGGIRLSNIYRIDRIFTVYSLGVDVLFKNGADSFNRLNGELDDFIEDTKI